MHETTLELEAQLNTPTPRSGKTELTHWGVIRAQGPDATSFLQGQLTQDVLTLTGSQAKLAAFCNAKGRMQASFVVFQRNANEIFLLCDRGILAATLKRLSMFVLRAKVQLTDASADFVLYGLAGRAIDAIEFIRESSGKTWQRVESGDQSLIYLPAGNGQTRALWCAPAGSVAPAGETLPLQMWAWLEVQSGIAMMTPPIVDALVPQMLNYESVGGVNFKKGCYPGQEVIARSQFRGTLKRRTYLVHTERLVHIGQEIFHSAQPDQPCGLVVAAAAHPDGGFDALVTLQTSAADVTGQGFLYVDQAAGPVLNLLPLPYALLEDI